MAHDPSHRQIWNLDRSRRVRPNFGTDDCGLQQEFAECAGLKNRRLSFFFLRNPAGALETECSVPAATRHTHEGAPMP